MNKTIKIFMLSLIIISVIGCGCTKEEKADKKDDPSVSDSEVKYEDETSRVINDFEALKDQLVGTKKMGDNTYEITVYMEDAKAVNAVMRITCSDNDAASLLYGALYNTGITKQAVLTGNLISYDYEEDEFVFKEMTKDQVKETLNDDGYEVK